MSGTHAHTIQVGTVSLLEPSLVQLELEEGKEVDTQDVIEINDTCMKLSNDQAYAQLILMNKPGVGSTPDARKLSAQIHTKYPILAVALVVSSLSEKLIANFYIKFNRPAVPTRMFTNEKEALNWLHEQLRLYKKKGG